MQHRCAVVLGGRWAPLLLTAACRFGKEPTEGTGGFGHECLDAPFAECLLTGVNLFVVILVV